MSENPAEPTNDALADEAAELIRETNEKYEQNREEQAAFLDTVAEEEGATELETECNLIGDYTVTLRAKLNGDVIDRLGQIDARLERVQSGDAPAYEISEVADDVSQVLADVIDGDSWTKARFYEAYRAEGVDPLGVMLKRVFESLQEERERREGTADGFRSE